VDAGVECRNSMDSPTVWRMEEGGCCRGVHGCEDRRGVPRQDLNPDSLLRLGLPNSVEEGGSCRGVEGGGGGGGVPRQDPDLVLQIGNPPILGLHLHTEYRTLKFYTSC